MIELPETWKKYDFRLSTCEALIHGPNDTWTIRLHLDGYAELCLILSDKPNEIIIIKCYPGLKEPERFITDVYTESFLTSLQVISSNDLPTPLEIMKALRWCRETLNGSK